MIQFLRGNKSSLDSSSTIFQPGQPIFEQDSGQLKIGNGTDIFSDLPYVGGSGIDTNCYYNAGNYYADITPSLRLVIANVTASVPSSGYLRCAWQAARGVNLEESWDDAVGYMGQQCSVSASSIPNGKSAFFQVLSVYSKESTQFITKFNANYSTMYFYLAGTASTIVDTSSVDVIVTALMCDKIETA